MRILFASLFHSLQTPRTKPFQLFRHFRIAAAPRIGFVFAASMTLMVASWSAPAARAQAGNFGSVNVCPSGAKTPAPCSATQTLTFNIAAGTTIGSIKVLTLGTADLDFQREANDTSTTLCTPQTYPSATTCTVDVTFAPLYAGQRRGAVQILDGSGNVLAATNIYGTGTAPTIAFTPATQLSLVGGPGFAFGQPAGVAIDGSGNIFIADFTKDAVYEMLAAGGYTTVNTLGGGFAFVGPSGVAVDGAGNVFVSDFTNKAVYEILAADAYTTVNTLASSFTFDGPTDLAIDGSGNLFVSDVSTVNEILAAGGYTTVVRLASGFTFGTASGLAVDDNDNVFVTDFGKDAVYEILAAGGYTTVNQLASSFGFKSLLGIAVSTSGNVFIADGDFTTIFEILATGGYTTVLSLGSGFGSPQSISVAASGNVYVGDAGAGARPPSIQLVQRSQPPPPLSFATTKVGATSNPRSVQFENVGNQPLTGTGSLSDTLDFNVIAGPDIVPDCDGILSLNPGALCNVSFNFTPQSAGPLSAALTLSDNSLNSNPATQTIQLNGSVQIPPQIGTVSPNYGAPAAFVTVTGTNFGATQANGFVVVGAGRAQVISWSDTSIIIRVPSTATTGSLYLRAGAYYSNGVAFTVNNEPSLSGISTTTGSVGTPVTFTGTNLTGNTAVTFNGTAATILSNTATQVLAAVPSGATSGRAILFVNGIALLASNNFVIPPFISSVSPNYGAPAATITITGTSFGATQGHGLVIVGGARPDVTAWSDTSITFRVPSTATTGDLVVVTELQTSNSVAFTVYPYPAVTGISPGSGAVGTPVTITGTNLLDSEGNATVTFRGIPAAISSDTSGSIQVTVPAGATSGRVLVKVNGVTLIANPDFIVTPSS